MNVQLAGKVALVTGASRGIGRAIAQTLANEGMSLVLVARSGDLLDQIATTCATPCVTQTLDLRDPAAAEVAIAATIERFGQLDLLVNNAGATKRGDFLSLADSDWQDGFALKFYGSMRLCRAAWPYLMATSGSIVNIIGIGGRTAQAEFTIGGSVNAALLNLTKALADRGIRDGVRVNAINPGSIATERLHTRIRQLAATRAIDETAAANELAAALNITRFGEPAEIANAVAWLASPLAAYCQGAILDIDGGQTRTL